MQKTPKIQKVESKYEVHFSNGEIKLYDTLADAEKATRWLKKQDYDYYFVRRDYKNGKKVGEFLI
jgi:hypothetical protein